ncbi:hypothetical protein [Streptomyces violaceoruber]|uniref:hypothetical protein n=1 Tax=Streptomyces violaceoruber TaxID=1935 RepID=UPI00403C1CF4
MPDLAGDLAAVLPPRPDTPGGEALPTETGDVLRQGEILGRRVQSVRLGWDQLTSVQLWMCEQVLGIESAAEDEKPRRTRADKWALNYQAAKQFYEREGTPPGPKEVG